MVRSTSRNSHPFDKMLPKMKSYFGSITRKVLKQMHVKKQRQHNSELEKDIYECNSGNISESN